MKSASAFLPIRFFQGKSLHRLLPGFGIIALLSTCFVFFTEFSVSAAQTTDADRIAVEVTVYNSNIGLIKDRRQLSLTKGVQELRFMDVAAKIIPASVSIRSLTDPGSLTVIEQNYEYDLLSPSKLLSKFVGKDVKLYSKNYYTDREEIVTATVMSANDNVPVFRIGNEITFGHPGRIIFPEIPDSLIAKPTLVWQIDNSLNRPQKIEAVYLTGGITWSASYVLVLNEKDDRADLSGWVTVDNKSGGQYRNARLRLVAGDISRVEEQPVRTMKKMYAAEAAPARQFEEKEFFEYHIYNLERPTTIRDNQTKQISLLEAKDIPVKKEFVFQGPGHYYTSRYLEKMPQKVSVFIELRNRKDHNLGMPLPKGTLRTYKHDLDGSLQLVGENTIDHTPKDEKIRLKLGDAFDITAERKQTEWEKVADQVYESAYEITVRNHKREDIAVTVIETIPGDWKILQSSSEYKKTDVRTVSFQIPVPKDREAKLTYRVRLRY